MSDYIVTIGFENGQPVITRNGVKQEIPAYIWWQLEAQMEEGSAYWLRGPDVHKCHSEILDRCGIQRVKRG